MVSKRHKNFRFCAAISPIINGVIGLMLVLLSGITQSGEGNTAEVMSETEVKTGAKVGAKTIPLIGSQLQLQARPDLGGRLASLRWGGRELLFQAAGDNNNWGSTVWLSPQSLWGWPPIAKHDQLPYRVLKQDAKSVHMRSQLGQGVIIEKHIQLADHPDRVEFDYSLAVDKDFPQLAAWQISRVQKQGLVFFPAKQESIKIPMGQVSYRYDNELVWLDIKADAVEGKIIANGSEGWLAWLHEGVILVKIYPPVPAQDMATGEGDVEVYVSAKQPYIELEVQSAAAELKAGQHKHWRLSWLLLNAPDNVSLKSGSRQLADFVRAQLRLHRVASL